MKDLRNLVPEEFKEKVKSQVYYKMEEMAESYGNVNVDLLREAMEEVTSYGCEIQDAIEIGSSRDINIDWI